MWQSLVSRWTTTPSWLYHALKRNAPLGGRDAAITAAALPLAPVAAAAELAAELAGRGGTIAVVAAKSCPAEWSQDNHRAGQITKTLRARPLSRGEK